jgi:hypothetical protein
MGAVHRARSNRTLQEESVAFAMEESVAFAMEESVAFAMAGGSSSSEDIIS